MIGLELNSDDKFGLKTAKYFHRFYALAGREINDEIFQVCDSHAGPVLLKCRTVTEKR